MNEQKKEWKEVSGQDVEFKTLQVNEEETGVLREKKISELYGTENYLLERADGTWVSIAGSTVLKTKMDKVHLGQEVKIRRIEDGLSQNKKVYKNFKVFT